MFEGYCCRVMSHKRYLSHHAFHKRYIRFEKKHKNMGAFLHILFFRYSSIGNPDTSHTIQRQKQQKLPTINTELLGNSVPFQGDQKKVY